MSPEFKTMELDCKNIESVLRFLDGIFTLIGDNEMIQRVVMTLLCSAITCSTRHITDPKKRYKAGEEALKVFCDDALEMYRYGREGADIEDAQCEAKEATKN